MSSPATNHSSPASTPKRVPMGPIIVPPGGHSVPSTPPVVTIAPTKTVNGVWRSESRQVSAWDAGWSRGWPQAVRVGGRGLEGGLRKGGPDFRVQTSNSQTCTLLSPCLICETRCQQLVPGRSLQSRLQLPPPNPTGRGLHSTFPYSFGGWKPEIKASAGLVPSEASLLGL